jgi:hypothetical protein
MFTYYASLPLPPSPAAVPLHVHHALLTSPAPPLICPLLFRCPSAPLQYHFMDITQYPSKISMARAEAATAFPGPAGVRAMGCTLKF